MSAFKKLNKQDVFVTAYSAKKSWAVTGSLLESYNILSIPAYSGSLYEYVYPLSPNQNPTGSFPTLNYRSIEHLYYRGFTNKATQESGSLYISSSYDHYLESSLTSASRFLNTTASIYSIPRELFGTHIEPGSVVINPKATAGSDVFTTDVFVPDVFVDSYAYLQESGEIYDNGEGELYVTGSGYYFNVGNVIYSHGQLILTNPIVADYYNNLPSNSPDISWKSNHPIYTYNYHCKVKDSEFNVTQNPTIMSGSSVYTENSSSYFRPSGNVKGFATGSDFQPYFTTVGLYNDVNELIAVAKLGKAIPKSTNSDMTIVVKLDI